VELGQSCGFEAMRGTLGQTLSRRAACFHADRVGVTRGVPLAADLQMFCEEGVRVSNLAR